MFTHLTPPLWAHFAAASLALVLGAALFLSPKGTAFHRGFGIGYIAAMLVTIGSVAVTPARTLRIFGGFGFFHIFMIIGALSLAAGIAALLQWRRTRAPEALRAHQVRLAYSYMGLVMAGVSQMATNPRFGFTDGASIAGFWIAFAAVNIGIYVLATVLISRLLLRGDPERWRAKG